MKGQKTILVSILILFFFIILVSSRPAAISGDFGEHVSFYPTSTVLSTMDLPNGTGVLLEAKAPSAAVLDYYKMTMEDSGWSVLNQRQGFLAFSKDHKGVMIDVNAISKEKSRISISYLEDV